VSILSQRILLIPILVWAIIVIAPDLWQLVRPLGSLGFYVSNNGRIYDVTGPFDEENQSPAWRAGIRVGDVLDFSKMRCMPYRAERCRDVLAALGGVQFTPTGLKVTLDFVAGPNRPARQVSLVAVQAPRDMVLDAILVLDQLAGIAVLLAAAWLVWTRHGAMSWGFFLYVVWFNPGQSYELYAVLLWWPPLLLLQNFVGCLAEGAAYAGLLTFAARVPNNDPDPRFDRIEPVFVAFGVAITLVLIASYASFVGYRTETITRVGVLMGLLADIGALTILLVRRRGQSPEDYQRVRWVIWGCAIGVPAAVIAELSQVTTLFQTAWIDLTPSDVTIGLLYLVDGVFCLFVFEALRRKRVVSVTIPLRRVTILGVALSVPALLLHEQADHIKAHLDLPRWGWFAVATLILFLISRLHEFTVDIADRFFNRGLENGVALLGETILRAKSTTELDRLLTEEPCRLMKLTSAATFRTDGDRLKRAPNAVGWSDDTIWTIAADHPLLAKAATEECAELGEAGPLEHALPLGLKQPVFAVAVANPLRRFALVLYGPHASGTDINESEKEALKRLAGKAAAAYAELETEGLREEIVGLKQRLAARDVEAG
jgi:hypothetical protein